MEDSWSQKPEGDSICYLWVRQDLSLAFGPHSLLFSPPQSCSFSRVTYVYKQTDILDLTMWGSLLLAPISTTPPNRHCGGIDIVSRCGETCSHVAAALFKVEACNRLEIAKQTCTSQPCLYNQAFSKKVSPSPISDIEFYNPFKRRKRSETISSQNKRSNKSSAGDAIPPTNLCRQFLLRQIHSVLPSAAIFTVVPGFVQPVVCDTVEQAQSFDSHESSPESTEPPTTAVSYPNSIFMVAQDSSQKSTNVDLPLLSSLYNPSMLKEHISQDLFNSIKVTQSAAINYI
ncbi:PREDICTED: uncharacterized protein LOC109583497 [Amphimedon queenslandica]|uniref:Uncharacterized protein n=1 Tax=Amphimedon queenslandica TaxID=400682 RepID=A0AAN0JD31_AMPQE|nr:PREDICTED: uncharacterized protein LOC109583497 [Amphimedon queenslandica]|eukprot:XP_019854661.1 PREDICTED: uncharacterized protein LOC109583497 [Amphimedon queenslandica]